LAKQDGAAFAGEVARIHGSGALGESGRLRELFDYLAARGPTAAPATQAEIADAVFGQPDTEGDDATARVYVHRLRKRLEDFYTAQGEGADGARLLLPPGTYALRLAGKEEPGGAGARPAFLRMLLTPGFGIAAFVVLLVAAFLLGRTLPSQDDAAPVNAFWQPFLDSPRPKLLVIGDYYIYGEIDPVRPEEGRLIRDFRVNSPLDLELMQDLEPDRYGNAEDVGLNYLPFSSAYALREIAPVLSRGGREIRIVPASGLESDMFNRYDVIYVGLFSGMALLEDTTFRRSGFTLGESYDELIDKPSGKIYTSEEARRIASPVYYRDYGYVARFRTPGGALVGVVAGTRDTGLRGMSTLIAAGDLGARLEDKAAGDEDFEVLYEITGQEGADLSERLVVARPRPAETPR
jgi:hypothetical protein